MKEKLIKKIIIGKNSSGKTNYIEDEWKKLKKDKKNTFYIKSEYLNPNDDFSANSEAKRKKTFLYEQFIPFLRNIFQVEIDISKSKINKIVREEYSEDINEKEENLESKIDFSLSYLDNENHKINFSKPKLEFDASLKFTADFEDEIEKFIKSISKCGSGTLRFLLIKFIFMFMENIKNTNTLKDTYLLIDEPELYLHPSLIREISYYLNKISRKINVTLISHSPEFISNLEIGNDNFILKKLVFRDGKCKIKEEYTLEDNSSKLKHRYTRSHLMKALFADKIIISEGGDDLDFLEKAIYYINDNLSKEDSPLNLNYQIILGGRVSYSDYDMGRGKTGIVNLFKLLTETFKIDKDNILIVFDEDLNSETINLYEGDNKKPTSSHKKVNESIKSLTNKSPIFTWSNTMEIDLGCGGKSEFQKRSIEEIAKLDSNKNFSRLERTVKLFLK